MVAISQLFNFNYGRRGGEGGSREKRGGCEGRNWDNLLLNG